MGDWLDEALDGQYQLIKVLRKTDTTEIVQLRNRVCGADIVRRSFIGTGEVYSMLARYSHPNISRVYDVYTVGGKVTVLEEYIDGITVGEILQTGLCEQSGVRRIITQLCGALEFIHSIGVIHRDIKPENVMLNSAGEVKLIDWGAARIYKRYINVMLTGEHPSKRMCQGPLRRVVERCTRLQPDERFSSAASLKACLNQ